MEGGADGSLSGGADVAVWADGSGVVVVVVVVMCLEEVICQGLLMWQGVGTWQEGQMGQGVVVMMCLEVMI